MVETGKAMDWTCKAAILSWEIGRARDCPDFQNYAMERLVAAHSRPTKRALAAQTIDFVWSRQTLSRTQDMLGVFFQDLVVRNWGDETVVSCVHLEIWSKHLISRNGFALYFLIGTLQPLGRRRAQPMKVEHYFVIDERKKEEDIEGEV